MNKIIVLVVLSTLSICVADEVRFFKPSFSCEKVKEGSVEYKICTDEKLVKFDNKLSNIYQKFLFISKEIKSDQKTWIKKRNNCKSNHCIQEAYIARIKKLNISLSNQKTFSLKALEFLKKSQEAVKVTTTYPEQYTFQDEEFFKDLFTFQNIIMEEPLVQKADYNNTKLKKILGEECWNMHLEYSVGLVKEYEQGGELSRGVREYHGNLSKEFSAWQVDMNDDNMTEVMFLQHFSKYDYYSVIDKKQCKDFSFIPYSGDTFECEKRAYPDIYYFYETDYERERIYPFCTLEQKVFGRIQKPSITRSDVSTFVINWKGKHYLMEIYNLNHSYRFGSGVITISVHGTKKLIGLCQRDYLLTNKDNK